MRQTFTISLMTRRRIVSSTIFFIGMGPAIRLPPNSEEESCSVGRRRVRFFEMISFQSVLPLIRAFRVLAALESSSSPEVCHQSYGPFPATELRPNEFMFVKPLVTGTSDGER